LPETQGARLFTGILQAAAQATIAAIDIGLDQPAALQVLKHGFDQARCGPETSSQGSCLQGPSEADFLYKFFEHNYNPSATAR